MLYDKRWDKQTKADPFTLEGLIAWLEKQPADKSYSFFDCKGDCLIGQYIASHGFLWREIDYKEVCDRIFGSHLVAGDVLSDIPRTFCAALTRARAAFPLSQRGEG